MSSSAQGVLDLSFYEIRDEGDITKALVEKEKERVKAATLRTKQNTAAGASGTGTAGAPGTQGAATGPLTLTKKVRLEKRFVDEDYKAIRLSNNSIADLGIIPAPLLSSPLLRIDFDRICWLDVSFNSITALTDAFVALMPNLCTLNLHANAISKLSDIKKLAALKRLRSLTMCGNPVADSRHYRNMVLHFSASTLVQLDFGCITNSERQKALIWEQIHRKKLHPED